jgi:hypothetical protein
MLGLRKQPNLNNLLCRAIVRYPPTTTIERKTYFPKFYHRLGQCKYCPKISKQDLIITSTGRKFYSKYAPQNTTISCELKNIIYCITCVKCNTLVKHVDQSDKDFMNIQSLNQTPNPHQCQDISIRHTIVLTIWSSQLLKTVTSLPVIMTLTLSGKEESCSGSGP